MTFIPWHLQTSRLTVMVILTMDDAVEDRNHIATACRRPAPRERRPRAPRERRRREACISYVRFASMYVRVRT